MGFLSNFLFQEFFQNIQKGLISPAQVKTIENNDEGYILLGLIELTLKFILALKSHLISFGSKILELQNEDYNQRTLILKQLLNNVSVMPEEREDIEKSL